MRFSCLLLLVCLHCSAQNKSSSRSVYQDSKGVIRWSDSKREVALFGANYCLPSACDFRAAGYFTNNRKAVADADMAHFARMGWDALRLCLWGDYENSDSLGNLVVNEHLDLMDYVIATAKKRGIYFLLSPIVTYSSLFPDGGRESKAVNGFSTKFRKDELGTNPRAIAAQQNYLKQLLNHVNPYTGIALKDEPNILFIEMINEPTHHSNDIAGSIAYINALVDAVKSTGCKKLLYHNYTQDMKMAEPISRSRIDGMSFAWYPTGLNRSHTLPGNYLPVVDHFSEEMMRPELKRLSRIVYEFDSPDLLNAYMYPAMARSFREVGAQFATMFSYDMLVSAPYNMGWQTHYLNMVYTPKKAVSAMIAAEVMRRTPLYETHGNYPDNTSFGPFRLSYEQDLSEMNTEDYFMYANNTVTKPKNIDRLTKLVGFGSSPVVSYEGQGIYFLDKISTGVWRLEVYPDAVQVCDPFELPAADKVVTRAISREWPMSIRLNELGTKYFVQGINEGNNVRVEAASGTFKVQPGVYILSADKYVSPGALPQSLGFVNMKEFFSPADQRMSIQVIPELPPSLHSSTPQPFRARVISGETPDKVTLYVRQGRRYAPVVMEKDSGYYYKAMIPANHLRTGWLECCIVVEAKDGKINYPALTGNSPTAWNYVDEGNWKIAVVDQKTPLKLLTPSADAGKLNFTRTRESAMGIFNTIPSASSGDAALRLNFPAGYSNHFKDYAMSLSVGEKIRGRGSDARAAKNLLLTARGLNAQQQFYVVLVEKDGTSWAQKLMLNADEQAIALPISGFRISKGAMLPIGYPGDWRYWFEPASGRGGANDRLKPENIEWIQFIARPSDVQSSTGSADSWMELSGVSMTF